VSVFWNFFILDLPLVKLDCHESLLFLKLVELSRFLLVKKMFNLDSSHAHFTFGHRETVLI